MDGSLQDDEPRPPGEDKPWVSATSSTVTTGSNNSSTDYDNKLFVGGLSWQTTPERLRVYFSLFGPITDVVLIKDPITMRSRGFGFITFSHSTTVGRVLAVPIHRIDGKRIDPKHVTPRGRSGRNKTKKLFVGGVSQETSVEEVKAYFSTLFGKVEEAVMLMDQRTKRHRGFGFVTFESEDVVDRICEIHFHFIKGKKVECKKAQLKESNSNPLPKYPKRPQMELTPSFSTLAAQVAAANFCKMLGRNLHYSAHGHNRYSPYPPNFKTANNSNAPPAYYDGPYALPNPSADASGFQNFDWSGRVYNYNS